MARFTIHFRTCLTTNEFGRCFFSWVVKRATSPFNSFSKVGKQVDCEQSLFFFRFSKGVHACASVEWQSRETRETVQSRAWSFACLGRFARRTKIKERPLVVYKTSCTFFVARFIVSKKLLLYSCSTMPKFSCKIENGDRSSKGDLT